MAVIADPGRSPCGQRPRVGLSGIVLRFAEGPESAAAVVAARATLAQPGCSGRHVDALVVGAAHTRDWRHDPDRVGADILEGLGFEDIPVIGTTLGGHANLATTLRVAANLLAAEGASNVLVVETVVAADGSMRPGALSMLLTAWQPDFEVLSLAQATHGHGQPHEQPILNGYRDVIEQALARSVVGLSELDAIFLADSCDGAALAIAGALRLPAQLLARRESAAAMGGASLLHDLQHHTRSRTLAPGARLLLLCRAGPHHFALACRKSS
jgi:3-oxoacyl-[acyl-carrier-protein] synthase III